VDLYIAERKKSMSSQEFTLKRDIDGTLVLILDGRDPASSVRVICAAPLSHPTQYITFLDGKGHELCTVDRLDSLSPAVRLVVEELDGYYVGHTIQRINELESEFGIAYWDVDTPRGQRDFVVKDVQSSITWLSPTRLLIMDVDGNRFEIPDSAALDPRSQNLLDMTL
jgi:hypothetical protein